MALEEPKSEAAREVGPARRRRALRAERQNMQALIIAAIPIVVLLAVIAIGIWVVQSGKQASAGVTITVTHLPTLKPSTLVAARKTAEPTLTAPAATAATVPQSTTEPTPLLVTTPTEAPSEPTATSIPEGILAPGSTAQVTGTNSRGLRMRSGPGLGEPTLKVIAEGALVQVLAGPTEADGYQWYQIKDDTGAEGWAAGDWLVSAK